ncbi:MAG: FAD-dependent oxidoreductase [Bosea sp.]|uniref:FAD-dependent oxidoreductase n=1 Tax=Bosea sp. (in: a-proteobacteria) TaxID=1871050 RepID=UPI001AD312AB|nr:FAD-dependent oxidoreductase [Bosea sp. (in: a-proteobacteria)]MBN9472053.1 FAD-dependent oxidoreductase [Bosea sp. (in: a-proteobacteria)]
MQPFRQFAYRRSPDQDAAMPVKRPVVVVGAGPVGLTLALDLARRAVPVVLIDDADRIGEGSRAICFAKRTLEIFDRLGLAQAMVEKGVTWQKGMVFRGEAGLYEFDLLPEGGHKQPAFINLQQFHVEAALVDAVLAEPLVDLRWSNRLIGLANREGGVALGIATPEGEYTLHADWLIACDGARSPSRDMLGLEFRGEAFEDRFLIADVTMQAPFPTERWFWFDPPFHSGQSALLHKQPDDVWRIDLQLSPDADPEHEKRPEIVRPRIERMLGHAEFALEWVSVYRFQCRRLDKFLHGRVIFAGDAAHQVSPFGARGANSGIQDADNLGWKLALVLQGRSPVSLLESYDGERGAAADENILNSTRATDFIAPRSPGERLLRAAALSLAPLASFAQRFVNSGRLSLPSAYADSPLSTPDSDWEGGLPPGAPFLDAPLSGWAGGAAWLSEALRSGRPVIIGEGASRLASPGVVAVEPAADTSDILRRRYALAPGDAVVLRPDGHVAARFHAASPAEIAIAIERLEGRAS